MVVVEGGGGRRRSRRQTEGPSGNHNPGHVICTAFYTSSLSGVVGAKQMPVHLCSAALAAPSRIKHHTALLPAFGPLPLSLAINTTHITSFSPDLAAHRQSPEHQADSDLMMLLLLLPSSVAGGGGYRHMHHKHASDTP